MRHITRLAKKGAVELLRERHESLVDPEKMEKFMAHLRTGVGRRTAAVMAGFLPKAIERAYGDVEAFALACDEAEAEMIAFQTRIALNTNDPKVAIRNLESLDPDRWSSKRTVKHDFSHLSDEELIRRATGALGGVIEAESYSASTEED